MQEYRDGGGEPIQVGDVVWCFIGRTHYAGVVTNFGDPISGSLPVGVHIEEDGREITMSAHYLRVAHLDRFGRRCLTHIKESVTPEVGTIQYDPSTGDVRVWTGESWTAYASATT